MTAPGGSTDIGSLLAYLKMDASQFDREVDQAGTRADALSRHSPDITIRTNAKEAIAQLAAVDAAQRKLADATGRVDVAQARLNAVNADANASDDKRLAAQKALERALNARESAATRLVTAQHNLVDSNRRVTAEAEKLADAERQAVEDSERFGDSEDKVGKKAESAERDLHLLQTAMLALGPAAIPIAAGATAAVAGLAPVLGTAVLAVLGLRDAWKSGALAGTTFAHDINDLQDEFTKLKQTAAGGIMPGLEDAMESLKPLFPIINSDVAALSGQIGNIAGKVGVGLVELLTRLSPLFLDIGGQLIKGAQAFDRWAFSSKGISQFVDYAQENLPKVEHLIGAVATAIGRIVRAAEPIGNITVKAITDLAIAIDHIPVPVLTALLATLTVSRLTRIASGLRDITLSLGGFVGPIGLAVTAGVALKSLLDNLGVSFQKTIHGIKQTGDATLSLNSAWHTLFGGGGPNEKIDSVTTALLQSGGALDDTARKAFLAQLQYDGLGDKAGKAGISLNDLVDGITGSDDAFNDLIATWKAGGKPSDFTIERLKDIRKQFEDGAASGKKIADASTQAAGGIAEVGQTAEEKKAQVQALDDKLSELAGHFGITSSSALKLLGVMGITQQTIDDNAVSVQDLSQALIVAQGAYANANVTQTQFLDSLSTFAQSAGTAADRAKLIGETLVAANGDALSFQTTMNNAAVAEKNLGDSLAQAASQVGKNGESVSAYIRQIVDLKTGTIDYTNSAAAPLLQGLDQLQKAGMNAAEATFQHETRTKGATKAADDAYNVYAKYTRGALTDQAKQLGLVDGQGHVLTGTIKKLSDGYFGLPSDVKTKLEQEGADPIKQVLRDIRDYLKNIEQGASFTVTADTTPAEAALNALQYKLQQVGAGGVANVGILNEIAKGQATGGPVVGPGPKGVDSVLRRLAPGEFVMSDKAVDKFGIPFMDALNKGQLPLTSVARGTDGAAAVPIGMPSTLVVVDQDGMLIGRMRVEAEQTMAQAARDSRLVSGRVA